jgi:hypothetical protein
MAKGRRVNRLFPVFRRQSPAWLWDAPSPDPPQRPVFQAPELSPRVTTQDRPREAGRPGRRPSSRRRGCALTADAPRPQGPTKRRRRDVRSTAPPLPKAWAAHGRMPRMTRRGQEAARTAKPANGPGGPISSGQRRAKVEKPS